MKRASIAIALASLVVAAGHAEAGEWRTVADVDGMIVMMRDTPGRSFPTIRLAAVIDENLFDLLAVLSDPPRFPEWMERCAESRVLAHPNEYEYVTYSVTDAPWPVSDRDAIYRARATVVPAQKLVMVRFQAVKDQRVPPRKGMIRLDTLQGYYALKVLGPRRTQFDYELDADPGGWVPKWIGKITAKRAVINTIRQLRKQVAKTRGRYVQRINRWKEIAKQLGL
jgi:hypothetical protein